MLQYYYNLVRIHVIVFQIPLYFKKYVQNEYMIQNYASFRKSEFLCTL